MKGRLDYERIAPDGVAALERVYTYIAQSALGEALTDLVYLRVSQINGCAYCIDYHTRDLLKKGMDVAKVTLLPVWHEARELFDAREQAALAWAETVTRVAETAVPDDEFLAASSVFSERELTDLTLAVGVMNAYNRLAIALRATPLAVVARRRQG